ncbi:MAG: hypothetical protein JXA93_07455 [Anaerolineae bacterium]|nr:hypothetical protein [Anaerolineae bacterium]
MSVVRRFLGILVMLAGVLGLLLSLAGLAAVWVVKPTVEVYAQTTLDTLNDSIVTSKSVVDTTSQALGATVDSVDALSAMLGTTADTLEDTQPVLEKFDTIMNTTLPATLKAATDSLYTAQEAAGILESTIVQLDAFRFLLAGTPMIGDLLPQTGEAYSPEVPLASSLGELATNIEGLPDTFVAISEDLSTTDEKLAAVQDNLITMSDSVAMISSSLSEYERMVVESKGSMDDLASILTNIKSNLPNILNVTAIVLTLLFSWLLAAQVVILSQGWELFQGTADRMEGGEEE